MVLRFVSARRGDPRTEFEVSPRVEASSGSVVRLAFETREGVVLALAVMTGEEANRLGVDLYTAAEAAMPPGTSVITGFDSKGGGEDVDHARVFEAPGAGKAAA